MPGITLQTRPPRRAPKNPGCRHGAGLALCLLGALLISLPTLALHYPLETYRADDGLPGTQVLSIHQDNQGMIWMGTFSGLCRFDGFAFHPLSYPNGPRGREIQDIDLGRDGTLWVATGLGLSWHHTGSWEHLSTAEGLPPS